MEKLIGIILLLLVISSFLVASVSAGAEDQTLDVTDTTQSGFEIFQTPIGLLAEVSLVTLGSTIETSPTRSYNANNIHTRLDFEAPNSD